MGPPIPLYEPLDSGNQDGIFISRSYDATSHFETTTGKCFCFVSSLRCFLLTRVTDDVRDIYRRAEKQELEVKGLREGESLATE